MARLKALAPTLRYSGHGVASASREDGQRERDRIRRQAGKLRSEYNKAGWRAKNGVRLRSLERDGFMCCGCPMPHRLKGKANAPDSPVVKHIEPHRGNLALSYDEENLQSVCKAYHDSTEQKLKKGAGS